MEYTPSLRELSRLNERALLLYHLEYEKAKKHLETAYFLCLFGFLGLHKFYLGYSVWGLLYLVLFIAGLLLRSLGIGSVILAVLAIFLIADFVSLPKQVSQINNSISERILSEIYID